MAVRHFLWKTPPLPNRLISSIPLFGIAVAGCNGPATARAGTLFRNLIDVAATVTVSGTGIDVRFSRRAHNPLMLNAGFGDGGTPIP